MNSTKTVMLQQRERNGMSGNMFAWGPWEDVQTLENMSVREIQKLVFARNKYSTGAMYRVITRIETPWK